jgi:hypothetical protein
VRLLARIAYHGSARNVEFEEYYQGLVPGAKPR